MTMSLMEQLVMPIIFIWWGGDGSFSEFTEPFGSSDGLNFWDIFNFYAFTFRLRSESLRDMDACLDAFDYFMLVNG